MMPSSMPVIQPGRKMAGRTVDARITDAPRSTSIMRVAGCDWRGVYVDSAWRAVS